MGVVVGIGTHWEIDADLNALLKANVDLTGLYVVRRDRNQDQRSLVGRIARVSDDIVHLSESMDDHP